LRIPVCGTVLVPKFELSADKYNCGHCFINYTRHAYIDLKNLSRALSARYRLIIPHDYDGMEFFTNKP
jgi:hypothetical protein